MLRSLFLAALTAAGVLSAAPTPQSFHPPLVFEPNRGQAQTQATWIAHGPGYELQLTTDSAVMLLHEAGARAPRLVKMKLPGSKPWSRVTGLAPTGGTSNYLNRPDGNSLKGIPHFARVQVADVYPGIDAVFYNDGGNLEYDFVVHAGADPKQIRIAFEGQQDMRVDPASGDLVLVTPSGSELRQGRVKVYQQAGDHRVEVAGSYQLVDKYQAAFRLAAYDTQLPLVIDPTLQLVQFLGGDSYGLAIAVDSAGNAYVTGGAANNFPVTNGSQYNDGHDHSFLGGVIGVLDPLHWAADFPTGPTMDSFVTKLNPQGTILFSSYGSVGYGTGIAVDSAGVVVTGWRTDSPSIPFKSGTGLFAWKLSLSGDTIFYQVLNGEDSDTGTGIALDSQHNAWISGVTSKTAFTNGPKQATPDAMALKVSPTGIFSDLVTLGGSGPDMANGVAVDVDDNPWFTGQTCSNNFPATPGFNYLRGKCGIFVAKLNHQSVPATTQFITVFGGSDRDAGMAIAVDANREAYVTGTTNSFFLYTSQGAYQNFPASQAAQGFITQFDGFGHYIHSTYLGSNGRTTLSAIALNATGEVYVSGYTLATTFPPGGPVTPEAGIVAKLSPDLSTLYYSTQEGNVVSGIALHEDVPSVTYTNIYSTGGSTYNSDYRAFVDKLLDNTEYTRLRNYWIGDRDINIQSGVPAAGQVAPGWWSAQWTFDTPPPVYGDPANTRVFWIHNRWQPDQYLNIESGSLQSTTIGIGWLSARWTFQPINGRNVYRICNVWHSEQCLNIESGALTASPVEPDWWSAWWIFDRVF